MPNRPTQRMRVVAFTALACGLASASGYAPHARAADAPALRGFAPATLDAERAAERIVLASPSESAALRHETALASEVHRMGTTGDYETAVYVRDALAAAGWDAKLATYTVPLDYPTAQQITLLDPAPRALDLYEPAIPGDPQSRAHAAIGIPYSGYSADGDVTGPLVYANHATPEDFAELARDGIDVRGAIVIARIGGGALTAKAFESAKHGALATLIFADPMDGGYFKGDTYPAGPWRPLGSSIRNTMTFTNDPGDPTAIGIPVPGAPHKPYSALVVPPIPEMPVTGIVAQQLMGALGGPIAPIAWHGGFPLPLHLGGTTRAHVTLESKRSFGSMWDVIATLRGTDPSQMVVVGGHRDAWTYGAVDPISGTVDLVQLGEAYGRAVRAGWKPKRTIVIGSWDGEELNLFGSEIWVEQNEAALRSGAIAYVNTDEVAYGPTFHVDATPELAPLARAAASDVLAPGGATIASYWLAQDPKEAVGAIGAGSDHEPFVYHENLPAMGAAFGGPFGTYHSAYDDLASLRLLDPEMHRAAAIARYTSLVTMRLADAGVPDVEVVPLANALRARLTAFAAVDRSPRRGAVVRALSPALDTFARRAAALDAAATDAATSGDTAREAAAYAAIRSALGAFYAPPAANEKRWQRSLLYGLHDDAPYLPTLDDTLPAISGPAALATLLDAFDAASKDRR